MVVQLVPPPPRPVRRDIIVLGCSAGGVEALPIVLAALPAAFTGTVSIVMHMAPSRDGYLVDILRRHSALPVSWAEQGELLRPGHVYVAPPDVHLLFNDDHLQLARTARENHSRPSIDKLFRSAAAVHGPRVAGVLLTGMLDDGVAGLVAIRDAGGAVIVQDPDDARFPDLPTHALAALAPDSILPLAAIGAALGTLAAGETPPSPAVPDIIRREAGYDQRGIVTPGEMAALGPQTSHVCPDCSGPLWELGDPRARRFRCYNGHVLSARQLLAASEAEVETALWSALRALEDKAELLEAMARDAVKLGQGDVGHNYTQRADSERKQVELMRRFVRDLVIR